MTLWLLFTLSSLATFALATLITKSNGPGWIFRHLRSFVARETPKKAHLDEGISCAWCVATWAAAAISAWLWYQSQINQPILWWLGSTGAAIALNQILTRE